MAEDLASTTVRITVDGGQAEAELRRLNQATAEFGVEAEKALNRAARAQELLRRKFQNSGRDIEAITRKAKAFLRVVEDRKVDNESSGLADRINSAGNGIDFGGLAGLALGPEGAVAGAVVGGVGGFFEPELTDLFNLTDEAKVEDFLASLEDLERIYQRRSEQFSSAIDEAAAALTLQEPDAFRFDLLNLKVQQLREKLQDLTQLYAFALQQLTEIVERQPPRTQEQILDRLRRGGIDPSSGPFNSGMKPAGERALGGSVYPGLAFLVGERGPEIFVPDSAGRILPNSVLTGGTGSDTLGDDFGTVIAEIERLGQALDLALEGVPEELDKIAETLGGAVLDALKNDTDVLAALEEAGRKAAAGLLHSLLQSKEVRAELGELADVIENVLTQALNGNIDSWEDLGRVALEVLDAIIAKLLETQEAGNGGGDGGGILGLVGSLIGSVAGAYLGGGSTVGGSFGFGDTTGAGGAGFSYTGYGGPRAGGGAVMPSRAFLVGEEGPELFVPNLPGSIVPNDVLGSDSGGMALNVTINAPGADREGLEGVRTELRGLRAALQQVNGSIEPRAAAEIARLADRGGGFARTVGRRAN